jgi:uncharacterized protein (TIGR03083 family)
MLGSKIYLDALAGELRTCRQLYAEAEAHNLLNNQVAACPGWNIFDVLTHLHYLHQWVASSVGATKPGQEFPSLSPGAGVADFRKTSAELLLKLGAPPETTAWTFAADHSVGFWQRRQVHEHLVHRVDLELAMGHTASTISTLIALDGVAEVLDFFAPRQVILGRSSLPRGAVLIVATDVGQTWRYGQGKPTATLEGSAFDLLLALWGRLSTDHPPLKWSGDAELGRAILADEITP